MKHQFKGFISGIIVATLVLTLGIPALAATVRQLNASYSGIQITLDGKKIEPKDANGVAVEPFTVDGTTYLPLRAMANALGMTVEWDGKTQTVKLGTATAEPETGSVLMDKNGIKITYMGLEARGGSSGGMKAKLLIENTTAKPYMVQIRDLSINGFMCDSIFSCTVAAGKKANDGIQIMGSTMEKNGIKKIETMSFYFSVTSSDDWNDSFVSEVVTCG